jgi:hypothetical protein
MARVHQVTSGMDLRQRILALAGISLALSQPALAQRWINPAGGAYANGANWDTGTPPTSTGAAVFDLAATYTVTLAADAGLSTVTVAGGNLTVNLGGHTLFPTANLTINAGEMHITNGVVGGSATVHQGLLVIESTGSIQRVAALCNLHVDSGAEIIVRGIASDVGAGGTFSVAAGGLARVESTGYTSFNLTQVSGMLQIIGGRVHQLGGTFAGQLEMNGGRLDGEANVSILSGTSHFYGGAIANGFGAGLAISGPTLIEGAGTTIDVSSIGASATTVGPGGTIRGNPATINCQGTGRLNLAGGSCANHLYRNDSGVLRIEPGSSGPSAIHCLGQPSVGLEFVLDAALQPAFAARAVDPFFSPVLSGSLTLEVRNPNVLRVGNELVLLTCLAPLSGSFSPVNVPILNGGRQLQVIIQTNQVVARVVAGGNPCWSADFDGDGDTGTDADIETFFACIAGNCCATCASADFNSDGDTATDADIEAFFRILAAGNC